MDKHTFQVLEYQQVREIIAQKTTCLYGRKKIEETYPLKDIEDIRVRQQKIREASLILESTDSFIVGYLQDVREYLEMAKKVIPLQPESIMAVNLLIKRARLLKQFLADREATFPYLYLESTYIETFSDLEKFINKAIGPEGQILDTASDKLRTVRHAIGILSNKIQGLLDQFLKNPEYAKMLQESLVTRREHRYVLPVKQEYRSAFPGIALDTSASGATVFMEPLSVLKLTNELKFQQMEEKREEELICLALSKKIGLVAVEISQNVDFLGEYDAMQASARFMFDVKGSLPELSPESCLDLKFARHPLLGERAVPVDIRIGKDFKGLIITGPNTGGKTVTLKITGLLTLLALAGFPIPAGEGSRVGMFTGVYADIGDEQSISQNLSTFSSHMTNIIHILPRSGRKTLVLLDEIGAGTDPSEGVALASAILKYLISRHSKVIATTHYNELKVFATNNQNFSNAAVEFDEETLKPTYRLQIGLPGRSCALKISQKLGFPEEVISEAQDLLGVGYFKVETLLSQIDLEKARAEKEREEAQRDKEEMLRLKDEYAQKVNSIESERDEVLVKAMEEADDLVSEMKDELREIRREWRKSLKDYREGKRDRGEIRQEEKTTQSRLDRVIEKLKKMKAEKTKVPKEGRDISVEDFAAGMPVKALKIGRRGKIVNILDESSALVEIGNIKMEIPLEDLKPVDLDFSMEDAPVREMRVSKARSMSDRMDIRGKRVDEGLEELSKFIDDAFLANLDTFQIVHGKGTGALRNAIHDYLRNSPRVKSFRDGEQFEGGWGVTVVKL